MKKHSIFLATTTSLFYIIFLFSCKKKEVLPRSFPQINTLEATIQTNGVIFQGEVINFNDQTITDHGFVWSTTTPDPVLGTAYSLSLGNIANQKSFQASVNRGFSSGLIAYYRAYVKTDKLIVYGHNRKFFPKSGSIHNVTGLSPTLLTWRDTLIIKGSFFDKVADANTIFFGEEINLKAHFANDSIIKVTVPDEVKDSLVSVGIKIKNITEPVPQRLRMRLPQITKITPTNPAVGDSITIEGNYFNPSSVSKFNRASIGGIAQEVNTISTHKLKTIIPKSLNQKDYTIKVGFGSIVGSIQASLPAPKITSVSPDNVNNGEQVTIIGENFSPLIANNKVIMDDQEMAILSSTNTQITFRAKTIKGEFHDLTILFAGKGDTLKNAVYIKNIPSFSDFSPQQAYAGDTIEVKVTNINVNLDKIYFGSIVSDIFLAKNKYYSKVPVNLDKIQVPLKLVTKRSGITNEIRVSKEFSLRTPKINQVIELNQGHYQFLGKGLGHGKIKLGPLGTDMQIASGQNNIAIFPELLLTSKNALFGIYKNYTYTNLAGQVTTFDKEEIVSTRKLTTLKLNNAPYLGVFTYNNKGYILYSNKTFLKIDPQSETVTSLKAFPANLAFTSFFQINNRFYIIGGLSGTESVKQVWEYDLSTGLWKQKNDFPGEGRVNAAGFSNGSKGYLAGGQVYSQSNGISKYNNDVWEYAPDTDSWIQKNNVGFASFNNENSNGFFSTYYNGKVYVGRLKNQRISNFFEYNLSSDNWQEITLPITTARHLFEYEGNIYLGSDTYQRFSISSGTWTKASKFNGIISQRFFSLKLNSNIYLGSEYNLSLYQFNPTPPVKN